MVEKHGVESVFLSENTSYQFYLLPFKICKVSFVTPCMYTCMSQKHWKTFCGDSDGKRPYSHEKAFI